MKIISLVPSITETLFDFGLTQEEVIGRTKFCIHPENLVKKVELVGGTKNLNLTKIQALNPDLIIANKEENDKSQVEILMKDFNVWLTNIENLADNEKFLNELGDLLNKKEIAHYYNQKIKDIFTFKQKSHPKKVAYLIWKNPYMTVGSDTFIHEILDKLGFENLCKNQVRYPEISIQQMKQADYIFLSTEPYPFKQKHIEDLQLKFPDQKIILVDGEAFSWYGTHLAKCGNYYQSLFNLDFR